MFWISLYIKHINIHKIYAIRRKNEYILIKFLKFLSVLGIFKLATRSVTMLSKLEIAFHQQLIECTNVEAPNRIRMIFINSQLTDFTREIKTNIKRHFLSLVTFFTWRCRLNNSLLLCSWMRNLLQQSRVFIGHRFFNGKGCCKWMARLQQQPISHGFCYWYFLIQREFNEVGDGCDCVTA